MLRHCIPTLLFIFSTAFAADVTADLAIARQHAGFSHDQIMAWAGQQKNYTLGSDDIIRMRNAGVPDDVVKALIDHSLPEPVTRKVDLEAPPTPPLGYDGWWTPARDREVFDQFVPASYETYETCNSCNRRPLSYYHFPDMPAYYCGSNGSCASCGNTTYSDHPYHAIGRFGYDTYPLDSPISYYGYTTIPAGFETYESFDNTCGMPNVICTRERDYIGNGSLYTGYGDMNSANEGGLTYHPLIGRGEIAQDWVCHTVCDTIPAEEVHYECESSSCNHCSSCSH